MRNSHGELCAVMFVFPDQRRMSCYECHQQRVVVTPKTSLASSALQCFVTGADPFKLHHACPFHPRDYCARWLTAHKLYVQAVHTAIVVLKHIVAPPVHYPVSFSMSNINVRSRMACEH